MFSPFGKPFRKVKLHLHLITDKLKKETLIELIYQNHIHRKVENKSILNKKKHNQARLI